MRHNEDREKTLVAPPSVVYSLDMIDLSQFFPRSRTNTLTTPRAVEMPYVILFEEYFRRGTQLRNTWGATNKGDTSLWPAESVRISDTHIQNLFPVPHLNAVVGINTESELVLILLTEGLSKSLGKLQTFERQKLPAGDEPFDIKDKL